MALELSSLHVPAERRDAQVEEGALTDTRARGWQPHGSPAPDSLTHKALSLRFGGESGPNSS